MVPVPGTMKQIKKELGWTGNLGFHHAQALEALSVVGMLWLTPHQLLVEVSFFSRCSWLFFPLFIVLDSLSNWLSHTWCWSQAWMGALDASQEAKEVAVNVTAEKKGWCLLSHIFGTAKGDKLLQSKAGVRLWGVSSCVSLLFHPICPPPQGRHVRCLYCPLV